MNQQLEQALLDSWQERQEYAEQMLPLLGKLYRKYAVEITVFGKPLMGASVIDIIKAHRTVRLHREEKLKVGYSYNVLEVLSKSHAYAHSPIKSTHTLMRTRTH